MKNTFHYTPETKKETYTPMTSDLGDSYLKTAEMCR